MEKTFRDLTKTTIDDANIIIAGLPFDENASLGKGAALAPAILRALSGQIPGVTKDAKIMDNVKIFDYGDIAKAADESVETYFKRISKEVGPLFKKRALTTFFGGDHSVSIPLFKAFLAFAEKEKKIPVLIHIDAHPDIMDEYLSNRLSHATPTRRALEAGLKPENLVFVGVRGFEKEEVAYFAAHPTIKVYSACDIHRHGIKAITAEIIEKYKDPKYAIYISYDIDANDPSFAPGTGTPEALGIQSTDTLFLLKNLVALAHTYALDVVEISPPLDSNNITSWLALKQLYELFYEVGNR